MKLEKDPLFREYVYDRNLKPGTIRSYKRKLEIYTQVTGYYPTQLIEQAEADEDNGIRMRKRRIKRYFQDLQDHLIENNFSPRKIVDIITTTRGFYTHFEIQVPKRGYSSDSPDLDKSEVPSRDDIKLAISNSSLRHASVIILMCSSGITLGDVLNLKYSDFLQSLNIPKKEFKNSLDIEHLTSNWNEHDVQTWSIRRQKSGTAHYTFNTPEATKYLFMYLEQNPPQDPDDYLFRGNTGLKVREDVFQRFLRKLNKKCGWSLKGRQNFIHSHSFRKYFSNTLEGQGMPHHYTRQMIGHRKDPLTRAYFFTPVERLKQEYFKFMPCLYFFEDIEVEVITDERLELMDKKLKEMEKAKDYINEILNNKTVLERLIKEKD